MQWFTLKYDVKFLFFYSQNQKYEKRLSLFSYSNFKIKIIFKIFKKSFSSDDCRSFVFTLKVKVKNEKIKNKRKKERE
jgi:hypothetical protein